MLLDLVQELQYRRNHIALDPGGQPKHADLLDSTGPCRGWRGVYLLGRNPGQGDDPSQA